MKRLNRCGPVRPTIPTKREAYQRGRFGNNLATGLAISAQCGYKVRGRILHPNCI
jgi:hypothetical protein